MANQPTHEWNTMVYHDVEKTSRDTITLARRVIKNKKSINPQVLLLEDPVTIVGDLSALTCTLLDILHDQGVTTEMVARLMGKMAGGREQAIHRLLPQVKKEIKLEMKESKSLTIPRLDQKRADIAAGKRHPKAKGRGKGPKSSQGLATDADRVEDDGVQGGAEYGKCAELFDASESKKRMRMEHTDTSFKVEDENKENEDLIDEERSDEGNSKGKDEGPISSQGSAKDVDNVELVVRENVEEVKCAEQVPDTSEGKKRKRKKDTNTLFNMYDKDKENEGLGVGEGSDEGAIL